MKHLLHQLGTPFNVTGTEMIAATDKKMIIAIPHAHDCEETDTYDVMKFMTDNPLRRVLTVNTLHNACMSLPPLEVKCSACRGDGEVKFEYWHDGKDYYTEAECPVCKGECLVTNPAALIKIGDHHIAGKYAKILNELAAATGCLSITMLEQNKGLSLFEVGNAMAVIAQVYGVSEGIKCASI